MKMIGFAAVVAAAWAAAAEPSVFEIPATVTLVRGWNAFYLPVTPSASADEIFADWPVERVGYYDQAAFLRTAQFKDSASGSTESSIQNGMLQWERGMPQLSSFTHLRANGIYLCYATNSYTATITGRPEAMRASMHVSDGEVAPINVVGVPTDGADAPIDAFLNGLDCGWENPRYIYGADPLVPGLGNFGRYRTMKENGVIAIDATKSADWGGPLYVTPMDGVDLGTNRLRAVVGVRNDSGMARRVRISMNGGPAVWHRELPTGPWRENLQATPFEKDLPAGAELKLSVAVDRGKMSGAPDETQGGIIEIRDVSSADCTHFRTAIALTVRKGAATPDRWQQGLWLAELTLDQVPQMVPGGATNWVEEVEINYDYDPQTGERYDTGRTTTNLVMVVDALTGQLKAGRAMKVRLLLHVDESGAMRLLQRVKIGKRKISAVCLPADKPVIPCAAGGEFGKSALFEFTVEEHSRVNPFRHALHPDHDGLQSDFKTPAPTGDDPENYLFKSPKPELFSIDNSIKLEWNTHSAADWNPEELLGGTCEWTFDGLRHECPIPVRGTFSIMRVKRGSLADFAVEQ